VGVRTHLLPGGETQVFLGRSPRVRPAEGEDRKMYDFWMPQLVVRRQGAAPLASLFTAVHEPFRGEPFLSDVRALPLTPPGDGAVALQIRHADTVDTVISTLDRPPYPRRSAPGGIVFCGRLAVLRVRAGQVIAAALIEGESLEKGPFVLKCKSARYQGSLDAALRTAAGDNANAFLTGAALPAGDELAGRWMIVTHGDGHTHGYLIQGVQRDAARTKILLAGDPGLRISGQETEECFFPRRKFHGPNDFVIPGQAVFPARRGPGAAGTGSCFGFQPGLPTIPGANP
jgi:hypothetical protein